MERDFEGDALRAAPSLLSRAFKAAGLHQRAVWSSGRKGGRQPGTGAGLAQPIRCLPFFRSALVFFPRLSTQQHTAQHPFPPTALPDTSSAPLPCPLWLPPLPHRPQSEQRLSSSKIRFASGRVAERSQRFGEGGGVSEDGNGGAAWRRRSEEHTSELQSQ